MNIKEFDAEFRRKIIAGGGDYKTAKTYGNNACLFMEYYKDKYASPLHATLVDMENYIIHLREKKYSPAYINSFIASIKRFYIINGQPAKCDKLVYHNNPLKTPNILTYQECMDMCNSKVYLKHRVIINLLYFGALRRSELLNIKIEHISKDRKITIVNSKYGKSRVICIPQHVLDLMREYYKEFKPKIYLLNSDKGFGQYSEKSVENVVKNVAKICKIEKRVYPHIMRSSRATHLLDNSASDMYVSELLGHEKIQTTKDYYCKLTIKGMQNNFDRVDELMKQELLTQTGKAA